MGIHKNTAPALSGAQWRLGVRSHVALWRDEVEFSHGRLTVEFLCLEVGELDLGDVDAVWSGLKLKS